MQGTFMRALVYHGVDDLRLEEWPVPTPGPGEAVVRVLAAGICGTDLRILAGQHRKVPPGTTRILGHELAGEVVALGAGVPGLEVGQWVFVAPNIGCGYCRQCQEGRNNLCRDYEAFGITLDGAFAGHMLIRAEGIRQGNVMPLEAGVEPAVATLVEPLACVLHGQDACRIQAGDTVLVIGAGPIGILHLLLARLSGAARVLVSEAVPERLAQALSFGADRGIDPSSERLEEAVRHETAGQGADVVLVAAPSGPAQQDALRAAAIGGRVNFFGGLPRDRCTIEFDSNLVHYRELVVTGTTGCSTGDCRRALALVNAGKLDPARLISARFPLEQAPQAFSLARERQSLKVVLEP